MRGIHVFVNGNLLEVHGLLVVGPLLLAVLLLLSQHFVIGLEIFVGLVALGTVPIFAEAAETSDSISLGSVVGLLSVQHGLGGGILSLLLLCPHLDSGGIVLLSEVEF